MNTQLTAAKPAPLTAGFAADAFTGAAYEVREIVPTNKAVSAFMRLHQHVIDKLPQQGSHWVKRRHFASILNHVQNGHIALGVFAGNKIVAQVLLTLPDRPGGANLKGYPIGYGPGQLPPEQCMVIQALGVHAGHREKGLRKMLLQKAEEIAHRVYRRHLIAKTDVANTASLSGFEKAGYVAGPETEIPGDAYKCVFTYKLLQSAADMAPKNALRLT